jgi:tryptophan-rich sensory protein
MYLKIIIFLVINFAALGVGSIFTGSGVPSEWYQSLNKAPWTPPGWMFGVAWTTIMICFSIFMANAWGKTPNQNVFIGLFVLQLILNILWSLIFFKLQFTLAGLIIIVALTILVGYFLFGYMYQLKLVSLLVVPYFLWLIIATSLNVYIYIKN